MNAIRLVVASIPAILIGFGTSGCSSSRPKDPIANATIRVVDRFGKPVEGVTVDVTRWKKPETILDRPYHHVASAEVDSQGQVSFENLLEGDSVSAESSDGRYLDGVVLGPTTSPHLIKLSGHSGFTVSRQGFNRIDSEARRILDHHVDRAREGLNRILDHHVATTSVGFWSLEQYVSRGVISASEAASFLHLIPRMRGNPSVLFLWGNYTLQVDGYSEPLSWAGS